jgi:hypothetical protein
VKFLTSKSILRASSFKRVDRLRLRRRSSLRESSLRLRSELGLRLRLRYHRPPGRPTANATTLNFTRIVPEIKIRVRAAVTVTMPSTSGCDCDCDDAHLY